MKADATWLRCDQCQADAYMGGTDNLGDWTEIQCPPVIVQLCPKCAPKKWQKMAQEAIYSRMEAHLG